MHILPLDISEKQQSRLRNGHPVRVKHGTGVNVVVSPSTYNVAYRAFSKGKASTVTLTPEEININKNLTPEQHAQYSRNNVAVGDTTPMIGGKLFGKHGSVTKFFKGVSKSKVFKDAVKVAAPMVKKYGMDALDTALQSAGSDPNNPMLNTALKVATPMIKKAASDKFDQGVSHVAGQGLRGAVSRHVSQALHDSFSGEDSGYMRRGALGSAMSNHSQGVLDNAHIIARSMSAPIRSYYNEVGAPPSRGTGIYDRGGQGLGLGLGLGLVQLGEHDVHRARHLLGVGLGRRREHHFIQGQGALHQSAFHLPPALVSQPYSANFQFQHFLPPQYQHLIDEGELHELTGSGLRARGLGLYA